MVPEAEPEALAALAGKKRLRIVQAPLAEATAFDLRLCGGLGLVQASDKRSLDAGKLRELAGDKVGEEELAALLFAWRACKHAKSNAIVLARANATIGIGSGQTSRVEAARQAIGQAHRHCGDAAGAVAASDGFLPFPDTVELLAEAGVRALVQPGGSKRDEQVGGGGPESRHHDGDDRNPSLCPLSDGATGSGDRRRRARNTRWPGGWPATSRLSRCWSHPATAAPAPARSRPLPAAGIDELVALAKTRDVDLAVVGPEALLAEGIADAFAAEGLPLLGPCREAARLEASKAHAKEFMHRHGIATARSRTCSRPDEALACLDEFSAPYVIKADGLAAGKGVVIAGERAEAGRVIKSMLAGLHGRASRTIVIEEHLAGVEMSLIALLRRAAVCGARHQPGSQAARRRRFGPQTPAAWGAVSPAPSGRGLDVAALAAQTIEPVVRGMAAANTPYRGFLYAGLMLAADGSARVLEYNCRLGDPEAQALLPLWGGRLLCRPGRGRRRPACRCRTALERPGGSGSGDGRARISGAAGGRHRACSSGAGRGLRGLSRRHQMR